MPNPTRRLRTWVLLGLSHDTFWLEVGVGLAVLAWAQAVWWMPGDLADRNGYMAVAMFASDDQWCAMGSMAGCLQIASAIRHSRIPRFLMGVLMCGFWLVIAIRFSHGVAIFTPSLVPYFSLAGFNALSAALPLLRRLRWMRA